MTIITIITHEICEKTEMNTKVGPKSKFNYYTFQAVNIDIGAEILKQKCFGHKTNFFNTYSNFPPARKNYGSSSIRISSPEAVGLIF